MSEAGPGTEFWAGNGRKLVEQGRFWVPISEHQVKSVASLSRLPCESVTCQIPPTYVGGWPSPKLRGTSPAVRSIDPIAIITNAPRRPYSTLTHLTGIGQHKGPNVAAYAVHIGLRDFNGFAEWSSRKRSKTPSKGGRGVKGTASNPSERGCRCTPELLRLRTRVFEAHARRGGDADGGASGGCGGGQPAESSIVRPRRRWRR